MGFPPVFTNVWDITQPLDTELANLLGQNIRDLKDDIMQRMSLLSGTLANRPTPETVNATWGGSGYGLVYFATDTGQVFQWNGAAWVTINIGGSKYSNTAVNSLINPTTGTVYASGVNIPANTLRVGSIVTFSTRLSWGTNTGGITINPFIQLESSIITLPINLLNNHGSLVIQGKFIVTALNAEVGYVTYTTGATNPGFNSFEIQYNGADVAANLFQCFNGLIINGSTNTTFTYDMFTLEVNI